MPAKKPSIKAAKPKNLLSKPLKFDFKDLFKSLANGAIHATATKCCELAQDSVNAPSAIGLAPAKDSSGLRTNQPTANIADLTSQLGHSSFPAGNDLIIDSAPPDPAVRIMHVLHGSRDIAALFKHKPRQGRTTTSSTPTAR